jgi:glutaredoxin
MGIKIYTVPHCPHSEKAKKFLKRKKLKFEEISIFKNEEARLEVFEKTSQLFTPVIDIGGEIIVGFDEAKLKEVLKKKS